MNFAGGDVFRLGGWAIQLRYRGLYEAIMLGGLVELLDERTGYA